MQTAWPNATVTKTEWVIDPAVPVTVALNIPWVEPETLSVDVAMLKAGMVTLVGLSDALIPDAETVSDTVRVELLRFTTLMVDCPEFRTENWLGFADIAKFVTWTRTLTEWDTDPDEAITLTE